MNKLSRVGIDLAKNVFQLYGVDRHGSLCWSTSLGTRTAGERFYRETDCPAIFEAIRKEQQKPQPRRSASPLIWVPACSYFGRVRPEPVIPGMHRIPCRCGFLNRD